MSNLGSIAVIFAVANVLAVGLGLGSAFLPKNSPVGELLRKSVSNAAVVASLVGVFVLELFVMRSGGEDRSTVALATDIFAAAGVTLMGPVYVGVVGTIVGKWLRSSLAARTVFCAITVMAAIVLMFGYWYATKR